MADVEGMPVLSGPEAVENGPNNSYELLWATADRFEALNLHPHTPGSGGQLEGAS